MFQKQFPVAWRYWNYMEYISKHHLDTSLDYLSPQDLVFWLPRIRYAKHEYRQFS